MSTAAPSVSGTCEPRFAGVHAVFSDLLTSGPLGATRLLSSAGCDAVFAEQAHGTDLVGVPLCMGMGYGINSTALLFSPNPRTCFWGGWSGSLVGVDCDARMVVAYVMNRMGEGTLGDTRAVGLVAAAYGALAG